MTKRSNFLYWLNVGGDLLYLLIVGGLYISGHSLFHGQMMLLAQVASGILIVSLPRLMERWWHFRDLYSFKRFTGDRIAMLQCALLG